MTKCDFCTKESVGYVSRQWQGPFYCAEHEGQANENFDRFQESLEASQSAEDRDP